MPAHKPALPTHAVPESTRSRVARWITAILMAGTIVMSDMSGFTRAPWALSAAGTRHGGGGTMARDTVLRHPDPTRPLSERWEWARAQARQLGGRAVWIGYNVRSSLMPDFHGSALPGARLAPLVGQAEGAGAMALLFRFTAGARPVLVRVHAGSFDAPVELGGEALVWLAAADDAASLSQLKALYAEAATADLREELLIAARLHGRTAGVVVPPKGRAHTPNWLTAVTVRRA